MGNITQTVRLVMDARKAATEMQRVSRKFDSLNSKIGAIAKTAGVAFAATQIISFTTETAKLAGEAEGVQRAFNALNDPGLLGELQKATLGTVSNLELMKASVQAVQLGISQNQLAKYFEFANLRAQQTGQSVDELVEKLVLGVGRESVLRLDDLGLSAKRLGEESKKAGNFIAGVGKIIDEELEKSGGLVETTATNFAQLDAEVENLKLEIGQGLLPVYKDFLVALKETVVVVKDLGSEELSGWTKLMGLVAQANPQFTAYANSLKAVDKIQAKAINTKHAKTQEALNKAVQLGLLDAKEAILVNGTTTELQAEVLRNNYKLITSYKLQGGATEAAALSLNSLNEELKNLKEEQLLATTAAQFQNVGKKINQVEGSIKNIKTPIIEAVDATVLAKDANVDFTAKTLKASSAILQMQTNLNNASAGWYAYNQAANEAILKQEQLELNAQNFNEGFTSVMQNMAAQAAAGFGAMLGYMAAGASGMSDFANLGIYAFASFATQLGQLAIQVGIGTIAIQQALTTLNGYAAIAAGVALVALGAFAKAKANSLATEKRSIPALAEGGVTTGATLALIGEGSEQEAVLPLSKLEGMINAGGGGYIPEFKIKGSDLLVIFNRAEAEKLRVG